MKNSYHNTSDYTGQTLIEFERVARRQDDEILSHLSHHPDSSFTAYELDRAFQGRLLLTSIRRALSNLERAGKIECMGYRIERWGKRNNTYKIK